MGGWDLIFPKKCVGCNRQGKYFCEECLRKIEWSKGGGVPGELDGLVSLFNYGGLVRMGLHQLKYRFLKDLSGELEEIIKKKIKTAAMTVQGRGWLKFLKEKPVVTAVPLYWRRKNWRGFNQAEILAEIVSRILKLKLRTDLVIRQNSTHPQTGLNRQERELNIKNCFKVVKTAEMPEELLLVDDVWTTGSTMKALSRVLKEAGVKKIWGWSLAR